MNTRQKNAMKHPDKLGAGASKRRKLPPEERPEVIMAEFKQGTLHSGSGKIVKNPRQAKAIIIAETKKRK